jgi:hypothetical protein
MNLHPDERPQEVDAFWRALVGEQPINPRSYHRLPEPAAEDAVSGSAERLLVFLSVGFLILSLFVTIFR